MPLVSVLVLVGRDDVENVIGAAQVVRVLVVVAVVVVLVC